MASRMRSYERRDAPRESEGVVSTLLYGALFAMLAATICFGILRMYSWFHRQRQRARRRSNPPPPRTTITPLARLYALLWPSPEPPKSRSPDLEPIMPVTKTAVFHQSRKEKDTGAKRKPQSGAPSARPAGGKQQPPPAPKRQPPPAPKRQPPPAPKQKAAPSRKAPKQPKGGRSREIVEAIEVVNASAVVEEAPSPVAVDPVQDDTCTQPAVAEAPEAAVEPAPDPLPEATVTPNEPLEPEVVVQEPEEEEEEEEKAAVVEEKGIEE
eukprot:Hpha_TRINITY_DN16349_c6_g2::TRINITY_DN16349_c6_g2_i2::g.61451::m.61451